MLKNIQILHYLLIFFLLLWAAPAPCAVPHPEGYRLELAYELPKAEALKMRDVFRQEGFRADIGELTSQQGIYRVSLGTFHDNAIARTLAEGIGKRLTLSTSVASMDSQAAAYPPPVVRSEYWTLQIGMFAQKDRATKYRDRWYARGYPFFVVRLKDDNGKSWWGTRLGLFQDKENAQRTASLFSQEIGKPLTPRKIDHALLVQRVEGELPEILPDLPVKESSQAETPAVPNNFEAKKTADKTSSTKTPARTAKSDSAVKAPKPEVKVEKQPVAESKPKTRKTKQAARKENIPASFWTLHIGSFSHKKNAVNYRDHWKGKGYPFYVLKLHDSKGRTWWVARMGTYASKNAAGKAGKEFTRREGKKLFMRHMKRDLYQRRLVP